MLPAGAQVAVRTNEDIRSTAATPGRYFSAVVDRDVLDDRGQRTMLLSVLILLGITALWRALRDGEPATVAGDQCYRLLGVAALPVYLLTMYVPVLQRFFELVPLGVPDWACVLVIAGSGYGMSLLSDRLAAVRNDGG